MHALESDVVVLQPDDILASPALSDQGIATVAFKLTDALAEKMRRAVTWEVVFGLASEKWRAPLKQEDLHAAAETFHERV